MFGADRMVQNGADSVVLTDAQSVAQLPSFDSIDKNKDGVIDRQEFSQAFGTMNVLLLYCDLATFLAAHVSFLCLLFRWIGAAGKWHHR